MDTFKKRRKYVPSMQSVRELTSLPARIILHVLLSRQHERWRGRKCTVISSSPSVTNVAAIIFNCKYYPDPSINKETFRKDIERLVKIVVLTPVRQIQYGTPIFIISKKEGTVRFRTEYCNINQKWARKPYPQSIIDKKMYNLK